MPKHQGKDETDMQKPSIKDRAAAVKEKGRPAEPGSAVSSSSSSRRTFPLHDFDRTTGSSAALGRASSFPANFKPLTKPMAPIKPKVDVKPSESIRTDKESTQANQVPNETAPQTPPKHRRVYVLSETPSPVPRSMVPAEESVETQAPSILTEDDFINNDDDDTDLNAAMPVDLKMFKGGLKGFEGDCDLATALARLGLTHENMQPEGLKVSLMPHQVIGVDWMTRQEQKDFNQGGVQADDMGLGKTVQTIATIVHNPQRDPHGPKNTLIVVPPSLLKQWAREIKEKSGLTVFMYHGSGRIDNADCLQFANVVLTTFDILRLEASSAAKSGKPSKSSKKKRGNTSYSNVATSTKERRPLFELEWYRIVLDEAHTIRNHRTATCKAVWALEGSLRWCLAARLVYNSLADIYALLRFIGVVDWNEYRRRVVDIASKRPKTATDRAQAYLRQVTLHRTHKSTIDGQDATCLPALNETLIELDFSPQERRLYDDVEQTDRVQLEEWYHDGTLLDTNRHAVFAKLLYHRQLALHPALTGAVMQTEDSSGAISSAKVPKEAASDLLAGSTGQGSTHRSSREIASGGSEVDLEDVQMGATRPMTKKRVAFAELDDMGSGPRKSAKTAELSSPAELSVDRVFASTKLKGTSRLLRQWEQEDPSNKTLIFCSFTTMLDLTAKYLHEQGHRYVMYTGKMDGDQKEEMIESFRALDADAPTVMLVSTKAGGIGLNLTMANHIIALELNWSPAVDAQAIARAHRIGQDREVTVVKLIVKDTVEGRILAKQALKQALADGAMGDGQGQRLKKLRAKDIMALFGIEV